MNSVSGGLPTRRYAPSINQNQHGGILCRLDHILKLPVSRDWFFEFGGNCRHGFEEAQQKTALHRVIHILRQRSTRRQRRGRIQFVIDFSTSDRPRLASSASRRLPWDPGTNSPTTRWFTETSAKNPSGRKNSGPGGHRDFSGWHGGRSRSAFASLLFGLKRGAAKNAEKR